MGSWIEACKEYALKAGKYTVPKKDSPEYAEIKKIAERLEAAKPRAAPGTVAPVIVEEPKAVRKALPKKVKAVVAVPVVPVVPAVKAVPAVVVPAVVTDTSVADVSKPRVRKPRVPKPAVVVDEVVVAVTPVAKKVRKTPAVAVSGVTAVAGPVTLKF